MTSSVKTFGRNTQLIEHEDFRTIASELASRKKQSVFFCNVHMLMLSQDDNTLASAMDTADWVFADSAPVAWLQRRLSGKDARVIPGYKVLLAICESAAQNHEKVGFFGSTPDVMENLTKSLSDRFDNLDVAYQCCPPYIDGELMTKPEELQVVTRSGVQWLFVGLGCPKQEKWIAHYTSELDCHMLGVGAAFDWLSGLVKKPPGWMERFALAWVYRLFHDPLRMWRRYLVYNSKFVIRVIRYLVTGR